MTVFEAYITNLGKYAEGQLVGETLKFPATTEEVQSLLKNIGVDGVRYEEFFITSFDGDVMGLYDYLTEYENLDELNHLAHLISELDSDEIETLEAALNKGDHTSSVADIINLVHNLDCYSLHPGVTDDETLGRIYVEDMELLDVPDNVLPYVLLSIVCALHEGEWALDEVRGTLQMLFDRQYILTEDVVVERRYYLETDTWTDEDGNTHSDTYRVYYDYYICTVTLENFNLSHLPVYIMGEETLSRYALYMATLGNRPDLFPSSPYVGKYTNKPPAHEIPEDYLADETFAAILKEAEKYVGYPYVWGGSSPSTSFDCSGFVSYVYNQCGWDFGRLGAQGLYNISTRTSSPKPGDLVFFTGTYDTPGISHVGIYVGDGWMLHCGDPISYANLNTSYWQSHFYAYGKLF